MDSATRATLDAGGVCDITTTGARSGSPHRIETTFHAIDDGFYLSGRPGRRRDWLANLKANPEFTLHLRDGSDLVAKATEITDPDERDRVLFAIRTRSWGVDEEEARATHREWVESSPLVGFEIAE